MTRHTGPPVVRRRPWITWSASLLAVVLALATLHVVVPHNSAQHRCTVCRTLHAPSLAGTDARPDLVEPDSFQTFPRTEERVLSLGHSPLPALRGPPAPPTV